MRRQAVLVTAGWLAAAVASTAVGVAAIETLGAGLFSDSGTDAPLSEEEVQRRIASEPSGSVPSTSTAPSSPAARTTPPVSSRALQTPGGTVHATCSAGLASLTAWSPAQGFRADDAERGPAATVSINFKRDRNEMTILVRCVNGEPTVEVIPDDD